MDSYRAQSSRFTVVMLVLLVLAACSGSRGPEDAGEPPQLVLNEPAPALPPPPPGEQVRERVPLPKKKPPEPRPAEKPPAEKPSAEKREPERREIAPEQIVGLTESETVALLGRPSSQEQRAPASLWHYAGGDCAATVIFYPEVQTLTWRVLDVEISGGGERGAATCLGEIAARRPGA